ncbi:MAG: DNA polymerase III subunit chi [Nitrosomonadales bacterium]|nr:DNA polymerase III subunit chi [Nitrosomonadales bacterium]
MTRIDFYTGSKDKLRTACQLSHKALQNGVRTVISLPDPSIGETLDRLLWHYPATAFIPHCRSDAAEAETMPVVLDHGHGKFPHHDLLISLHDECTAFFSRFERVIEIVGHDADDAQRGRARFKFYRDRGYEISHIDLTKVKA